MKGQLRVFTVLAAVALIAAILRYFMKGWVEPMGVSPRMGSFFASITVVFLVGLVVIFAKEGRAADGRYFRAVGWLAAFTLWCQGLVIAGILITEHTGTATYYDEMVMTGGAPIRMSPSLHALSHLAAALILAVVGSLLGSVVYWIVARGRRGSSPGNQA